MVLSFLFSGMEAGVLALNRLRIRQYVRAGNPRAVVLHHYLEQPENFLWTILIGNTLSKLLFGGCDGGSVDRWLGEQSVFADPRFFVVDVPVLYLLRTAAENAFSDVSQPAALLLASPFRLIHLLLDPPVALMTDFLTGFCIVGLAAKLLPAICLAAGRKCGWSCRSRHQGLPPRNE